MGLGVKKDMEIKVTADGEDEAEAVEALQKFFNENLQSKQNANIETSQGERKA